MYIFKKPTIKASTNDMGFKGLDRKYDDLINGWCAYWNYALNPKEPLHPNHVKALIATESSFQENHRRTPKRPAIGLMQIMPETIHLLSSRSKELKDHYLDLTEQDVLDPNVNICAGIRWLYRKYELSNKKNKSWLTVFENYKGISAQKGDQSDDIRNKTLLYYNMLIHE
jgi:soluble lytic murein transglycosylase-like protein